MSQLRLFVAVPLPESTVHHVYRRLQELAPLVPAVKWVDPANMHFTLAFLGRRPETELDLLKQVLDHASQQQPALTYQLGGMGFFPTTQRPHIIWIGVGQGCRAFEALGSSVQKALRSAGFALEERPFVPHLTVGRIKQGQGLPQAKRLQAQWQDLPEKLIVDKLHLMHSQLTSDGAVYTVRHEVYLSNGRLN